MRRQRTLFMIAASLMGVAMSNCSQSNQGASGSPDSAPSTEHRDAGPGNGAGGGLAGATGGTGGPGSGGVMGSGGAARGGSTGGPSATGGGGGTVSGAGGSSTVDASGATGGKTGPGGTGGSDAAPDGRAFDAGTAAGPEAGAEVPTRDLSADLPVADTAVDNPPSGGSTCNLSGAATTKTPTVYVIGDSTASVYTSDLYPRMGWAQPLQDFFAPACATVSDKALSGRSSKSFWDEGAWSPIKSALRAGDFVIIQFGHNDEKSDDAARYTEPFTTYEDYLSKYIDDTVAKGATPILATSINRNQWSGTTIKDSHGDYPVAMRQLAEKKKVALVDATLLTKAYFERIGQAATTKLFMNLAAGESPNYPSGNTDNTHLQEKGARIVAQMILADLYRQTLAPGTLAKTVPVAP